MIAAGAIQTLAQNLQKSPDASNMALWGLANLAGEGPRARDAVLDDLDILVRILALLRGAIAAKRTETVSTCGWMTANLCRKDPEPPAKLAQLRRKVPELLTELLNYQDGEVKLEALWGLTYFVEAEEDVDGRVGIATLVVGLADACWEGIGCFGGRVLV